MEMHLFVAMVIGMFDLEPLDPIPAPVSQLYTYNTSSFYCGFPKQGHLSKELYYSGHYQSDNYLSCDIEKCTEMTLFNQDTYMPHTRGHNITQ